MNFELSEQAQMAGTDFQPVLTNQANTGNMRNGHQPKKQEALCQYAADSFQEPNSIPLENRLTTESSAPALEDVNQATAVCQPKPQAVAAAVVAAGPPRDAPATAQSKTLLEMKNSLFSFHKDGGTK